MWLVDLNYNFECDWLIELSDNKLSNNKLSVNNLTSELVENRSFFKPITIEEIVIFMINLKKQHDTSFSTQFLIGVIITVCQTYLIPFLHSVQHQLVWSPNNLWSCLVAKLVLFLFFWTELKGDLRHFQF